jgi:hypothetical protein
VYEDEFAVNVNSASLPTQGGDESARYIVRSSPTGRLSTHPRRDKIKRTENTPAWIRVVTLLSRGSGWCTE